MTQHDGSVPAAAQARAGLRPDRPRSRRWTTCRSARHAGEIVTGLLYVDPQAEDLHDALDTVDAPLNALGEAELCPGSAALAKVNASLR